MKSLTSLLVLSLFSLSLLRAQDVDKNYLLGKFNQNQDDRFVQLDDQYTGGSAKGDTCAKKRMKPLCEWLKRQRKMA